MVNLENLPFRSGLLIRAQSPGLLSYFGELELRLAMLLVHMFRSLYEIVNLFIVLTRNEPINSGNNIK